MQAADEAGDGQLRSWILSIQAMLAAYTNRHQDVIDLTGAGLQAAGQAMVRLHLTRSHAELGQFDEARQQAEQALALHRQRPVDHTRRRAHELATLLEPYGEAEATQKILHELTRV